MSQKKNLTLAIDAAWQVQLVGVDEETGTVDDVVIDRKDRRFFKAIITRALGYCVPMFFEILNSKNQAGNICLLVRKNQQNKYFVVVEEKPFVNWKNEKTVCIRACRSSISSPEGSPIPAGSRKDDVYHLNPIELNNMRIAGPVECWVILQPFDKPLEANQKLISFSEFAQTDDGPGQAVLGQFLLAQN
jgi:hypothetical protein